MHKLIRKMNDDTLYEKGNDDKLNMAPNSAVKNYEEILKPHLKKIGKWTRIKITVATLISYGLRTQSYLFTLKFYIATLSADFSSMLAWLKYKKDLS